MYLVITRCEMLKYYCVDGQVCKYTVYLCAVPTNKCTALGTNEPLLQWLICCNFSVKAGIAVLKSCILNC